MDCFNHAAIIKQAEPRHEITFIAITSLALINLSIVSLLVHSNSLKRNNNVYLEVVSNIRCNLISTN